MTQDSAAERSASFLRMLEQLHERHLIGVEGVREVWLIRHGDAYTGLERLAEGVIDPPLSPVGHEQADRLAQRLAYLSIDAVWASDLRRAVETADVVARDHGAEVRQDPRLREVRTHWDEGHPARVAEPGEYPFPETEAEVSERVGAAVRDIAAGLPDGGRAIAVSHNAAIGIYVAGVLGLSWGKLPIMPMYTSVTILALKGERVVVRSLADATHLVEAAPG
ncbi:MAG TPA: histidine phosphatase family protein [Candidatus Dormibacteraeota bacterium]